MDLLREDRGLRWFHYGVGIVLFLAVILASLISEPGVETSLRELCNPDDFNNVQEFAHCIQTRGAM